ncbi:acyltransferase [Bacillus sp. USDA818B3_A]|uniref:acyltransferase n=1 Tax=Bacillus sp. USDA818B3_A TaxID=2698834 RepID=UPI001922FF44|nr:acyltransferase [Bacillus sp. USDA818B3_A]
MYFESLLDAVLGERQIFHMIECPVCGYEEIYYEHCGTKRLIGRACRHCNFVQKFDRVETRNLPLSTGKHPINVKMDKLV